MTKRILSILVAFLMVMAVIPMGAVAQGADARVATNPGRTDYTPSARDVVTPPEGYATVILNVPEDHWQDGTGYQMLLDADANAYGSIIPETGALTTGGDVSDATYAEFEYKIPENADGSLTTANIVSCASVAIDIPAGIYDWCITNPTPGDRMWIASSNGNVGGRRDDYEFLNGYTYEFIVTLGSDDHDMVNVTILDENGETPPVPTLDEALNVEGGTLHFETGETYPWEVFQDGGRWAAWSGNKGVASSDSTLTTTVTAMAGDYVSFDFMAWGEGSYSYWDHCDFYVNETRILYYGALDNNDWEPYTYTFETDGEYTLTWSYTKDSSVNPTGDYFAIDEVFFSGAVEEPPVEPEVIEVIEINDFVAPDWAEFPFYDVTVPEDAHYEITYTDWNWWSYEEDDGDIMNEYDVYDNEEYCYYQYFEINPLEGYTFSEDVVILVNGDPDIIENYGISGNGGKAVSTDEYVWAYTIDFSVVQPVIPSEPPVEPTEPPVEPEVIDTIELIGFVVPAWGEAPFYDLEVPQGAHYSIEYTDWNWYDAYSDDGTIMFDGEVFDNEYYAYYQYFDIVPDEGYVFDEDVIVLIDGSDEYIDFYGIDFDDGECYCWIYTIDFYVDEPVEPTEPPVEPTEPPVIPGEEELLVGYYFEALSNAENFTFVDQDGDGFNWVWQADYSNPPYCSAYEGEGLIFSASYDNDSGMALTPDNWAITPAVELPAGTARVTLYACGQDTSWAAEHFMIYAGTTADPEDMVPVSAEFVATGNYIQYEADLSDFCGGTVYVAIRHFNVTDMFMLNVDQVEIWSTPGEPVEPTEPPVEPTEPPVEPTEPPVEPTEPPVGPDEPVMGFYFETPEQFAEWTIVDLDGDGYNWVQAFAPVLSSSGTPYLGAYEGEGYVYSRSWFYDNYKTALRPDNWLISPAIVVPEIDPEITFWAENSSSGFQETIAAYVLTSPDADPQAVPVIDDFTPAGYQYTQYSVDLRDYAGQTIYFAIRHYNSYDEFYGVAIDAVEVWGTYGELPPVEPTEPPVEPTPEPTEPGEIGLIAGYYFETQAQVDEWTFIGANGSNWLWSVNNPGAYDYTEYAHEGSHFIMSYSFIDYVGAYQADNWAISPAVTLPEGEAYVSFYANQANVVYPEAISVYVGLTPDPADMILLQANVSPNTGFDDPWTNYQIDLSDYAGETIYLAFYDNNYDMYEIWIDQVEFFGQGGEPQPTEPPVEPTEPPVEPTEPPVEPTEPPVEPGEPVYGFYFETDPEEEGWQYIDQDGDGYSWYWLAYGINQSTSNMAYEGVGNLTSASYLSVPLTPDNWAVSPGITLTSLNGATVSFYYNAQDASWAAEHFRVYAGNSDDVNSMVPITDEIVVTASKVAGAWFQLVVDLTNAQIETGTVYFAIRHYNCTDMFRMNVDQFEVYDGSGEQPPVEHLWGDANGDGVVNSEDVLLMMRYAMDLQELDPENIDPWCDVNQDGVWDMTDALLIARYVNEIIDELPVID